MKNKLKLLPKGWVETTIEDICTSPQYGYTTKAVEKGDIKLLRTTDITSGKINWETVPYCLKNPENPEKYFLKEGDIVISRAGSVGISYLIIKPEKVVFASYLIRFNPLINKKHFKYFLESPIYWSNISEKKLGIAVQNVNATKLKSIKLPVPPLPEQQRIVAKIEELFSELDNGIENLKKAREQLKTYRQAVLKYAFEGKLTKEWRTRHLPAGRQGQAGNPPEPAEKLLEQVKTEREKHYQKQLEDWEKACELVRADGKKKPVKPKKPKELPLLTENELAELPELPEGWCYTKIDNLFSLNKKGLTTGPFGTALKKNDHKKNGVPVLGIENIGNGHFIPRNKIFVSTEKAKELTSFEVSGGDIIISRSGTVGEICIVPDGIGFAIISTNLISVLLNLETIIPKYFVYLFQGGGSVKDQVKELCKGSTRVFLNQTILRSIIFPWPNIEEQHAIVSEIESRLSVCDKIEQTIEESLKKAEALRQSILKKAFAGELTKDWREKHPELITGENSAEKLLEKIKVEKALSEIGRKKPRSKKTKKK
jgi:type I restriction enzyme S subunit